MSIRPEPRTSRLADSVKATVTSSTKAGSRVSGCDFDLAEDATFPVVGPRERAKRGDEPAFRLPDAAIPAPAGLGLNPRETELPDRDIEPLAVMPGNRLE